MKDNGNSFDAQGDRETRAEPPDSDDHTEMKLPVNQCDEIRCGGCKLRH